MMAVYDADVYLQRRLQSVASDIPHRWSHMTRTAAAAVIHHISDAKPKVTGVILISLTA